MSIILWKDFTTEKDGVKLEVTWWLHDFTAYYKVGDITLQYGRHIMAMCPMKYSEEWLKKYFENNCLYASFKEAGEIISNQQVFFEATKAQFTIRKKEQKRLLEELNSKLRELKLKFKAGELSQAEYQRLLKPIQEKKRNLDSAFNICTNIAEGISVINDDTKWIIRGYLEDLYKHAEEK